MTDKDRYLSRSPASAYCRVCHKRADSLLGPVTYNSNRRQLIPWSLSLVQFEICLSKRPTNLKPTKACSPKTAMFSSTPHSSTASRGDPTAVRSTTRFKKAFSGPERPPLTILQVGLEPEWKSPDNIFRGSPWKVSGIPTLFQVDKGAVAHRYEEDPDIIKKLDEIIG
ncbi:DUF953 domain-containing protein [Mycena venus]|uniref:DUF953 domain-containing protein n=1 Tax=Mycena venus TaxID=2733690 RepID=A0A8H6TUL7_9AGAR|nr:DUF953 domain-containing protein [Mycena venus]